MKYCEIEFKYRADEINFVEFEWFCLMQNPDKVVRAAGYDHFYDSISNSTSFARHRIGPEFNQLTFKRKTVDKNNYIRTEHNLTLGMETKPDQVKALCSEFGYNYNTSIFKNVFVYIFDRYNYVYYVCYDESLKELGRFIEVEMSEDYPWESSQEAMNALVNLESGMKKLGITPQARIRKSLFEMYKK